MKFNLNEKKIEAIRVELRGRGEGGGDAPCDCLGAFSGREDATLPD